MNFALPIEKPAALHVQIEHLLRSQIRMGKLRPGSCLPSTGELARQLDVNPSTVQKVMARLSADGLIVRLPKRGTFVKSQESPMVIGVLVGASLANDASYFQRAIFEHLRLAITEINPRWTCRLYDALTALKKTPDFSHTFTYQHFIDDFQNCPFKGLILISGDVEDEIQKNRMIAGQDLPIVRFHPAWDKSPSDVMMDFYHFGRESIEFIAQKGFKKILYLRTLNDATDPTFDLKGIGDASKALGLPKVEIHPLSCDWLTGNQLEQTAFKETRRILEKNENARPDVLLVSDDIATRGVVRAFVEKNICSRNLSSPSSNPDRTGPGILTMANEGIDLHYALPVTRYEFSPKTLAMKLLEILQRRITGQSLPDLPIRIPGSIRVKNP
ncbi:MAG: GntR family transcriptional regulator [Verrucomicrobiae bacterium]|nr:GntR family transcriptional regulator [Verrucomicrobiae bacterium]